MLVVAVIIYNRYQNLNRWLHCWKQCEKNGAQLIIIHNDNGLARQYRTLCEANKVMYIRRENIGFDIGAMQDVFNERLKNFPNDWKYLMWCTDDVLPMQKDFTDPFMCEIQKSDVGIAAMHISPEVKPHVRTGCFMIPKIISKNITFPVDPIITKKECYQFEHGENCLGEQVQSMGLRCVQVAPLQTSPMYDTEYWTRNKKSRILFTRFNREHEHRATFYQAR